MSAPEPSPQSTPTPDPDGAWRAGLGEMGNHPAFSIYKGEDLVQAPRAVLKSFLEAQALVGADKIAKPQESWSAEQHDKFWSELGMPATAKDYKLSEVKLPDGVTMDEGFRDKMLEVARGARLTNQQFDTIYKHYIEANAADYTRFQESEKQAVAKWENDQRTRLGSAYDATKDLAARALTAAGAGPDSELLGKLQGLVFSDGTPLLRHPAFLDVFGALGKTLSEGNLLPGEKQGGGMGRSLEQVEREMSEFSIKNGAAMVRDDAAGRALAKQYDALLTEQAKLKGILPT